MAKAGSEIEELSRATARIHAGVLAVVFAIIGGMGLFLMTVWLLLKGGVMVGAHLQLLGHYFIGYSVSWFGSLVGFFYGALLGGVIGWAIGRIYNAVAGFRQK
jgi:hypothetical protein